MTVTFEVYPPLATGFGGRGQGDPASWSEEVARGETLGRVLARLAVERPSLRQIYDPATRVLANGVRLAVNGRNYELVGGLTYFVAEGDRLSFSDG
jgi:hypothetical protein